MKREEAIAFVSAIVSGFDPTIDVSAGSPAYTNVVTPIAEKFTSSFLDRDVEAFLIATFRDNFPDIDITSQGSGARDLFIKPLILLLETVKAEATAVRSQQSFVDENTLSLTEARALAANLAVNSVQGDYAYGQVQVYYTAARAVSTDPSIVFTAKDGTTLVPTAVVTYTQSDFARSGQLYYISIPVRTVTQAPASIPRGSVTQVTGLTGYVRITNNAAIGGGTVGDTVSSLRDRALRSLSERSLNTQRGIETAIFEQFTGIISVRVVGFGDPEMKRDILAINSGDSATEVPGEVTVLASEWHTLPLTDESFSGDNVLPFTNKLRVVAPSATDKALIQSAGFLRVVAPNSLGFRGVLARHRKIAEVIEDGTDLIVKVADFEVYPEIDTAADEVVSSANLLHSTAKRSAYNTYAAFGELHTLTRTVSDVVKIVGAPLPIADWLDTSAIEGAPTAAIPGRDFIIVASQDTTELFEAFSLPTKVMTYPVTGMVKGRRARVGRIDSFLPMAERTGKLTDAVTPDNATINASLQVLAYGAPNYGEDLTYDGVTVAAYAQHAGVSVEFYLDGPSSAYRATVTRHPSLPSWESIGVYSGDFISLAIFSDAGDPVFDGAVTNVDAHIAWTGTGRIQTLTTNEAILVGITMDLDTDAYADETLAGFDKGDLAFPSGSPYRCAWTAFRGSERVSSGDNYRVQFYDQTLPQAAHFMGSPYLRGQAYTKQNGFSKISGLSSSASLGSSSWNPDLATAPTLTRQNKSVWIRLGENFFDVAARMRDELMSAELVLQRTAAEGPAAGFAAGAVETAARWARLDRYSGALSAIDVDGDLSDENVLVTRTVLPYSDGAALLSFDNEDLGSGGVAVSTSLLPYNPKGHTGYLLPYPAGPGFPAYWSGRGETSQTESQIDTALGEVHPVLLFMDTRAADERTVTHSVGDVLPTDPVTGPGVLFEGSDIHVGGMTDVYVAGQLQQTSAVNVKVYPQRTDILHTSYDGVFSSTTPSIVVSQTAQAFFETVVDSVDTPETLAGYVLLLRNVELYPDVSPISVPVSHVSADGIHTATPFTGLPESLTGVIFDVVRACTASLTDAVEVIHTGTNAAVVAGQLQVSIPAAFISHIDETTTALSLEILKPGGTRDASVARITGRTIAIYTAFDFTGSYDYRVVRRLPAFVRTPVGVVTAITQSSADGAGESVPYGHPLGGVIAGASAVSDEVINATSLGDAALSANSASGFLQISVSGVDWSGLGVLLRDVVVFADLEDPSQEFFVTEIDGDTLVLDRALEVMQDISSLYYVAHPAVATISVKFKDRTRFVVDADSVITTDDGSASFRVSFAAESEFVKPRAANMNALVVADGGVGKLQVDLTDCNILLAGARAGDFVRVETTSLVSTLALTDDTTFDINNRAMHLLIDGVKRAVVFSGVSALTTEKLVATINRQLSPYARIFVNADDYLELWSPHAITLLDTGSAGILAALGFDLANKSNFTPEDALTEYRIEELAYGDTNTEVLLTLARLVSGSWVTATSLADLDGRSVSARFVRKGEQTIYPADMALGISGLYTATLYVSSRRRVTATDLVGKAVTFSGYSCDGYRLSPEKETLSGSVYENLLLTLSPTVPAAGSTDGTTVNTLHGTGIDVDYLRSATVQDVQTYLTLPATRVVCNNPLARCFAYAYFVCELQTTAISDEALATTVNTYIASRYPAKPISVYELTRLLDKHSAGSAKTPITIGALILGQDRQYRLVETTSELYFGNTTHFLPSTAYVAQKLR